MTEQRGSNEPRPGPERTVCRVCFGPLDKAGRSLMCCHSFCQPCLQKVITQGLITCPVCQVKTRVPSGGIPRLPINFDLPRANNPEKSDGDKNSPSPVNSPAKKPASPGKKPEPEVACQMLSRHSTSRPKATAMCIQCSRKMCEDCTAYHNSIPAHQSHRVVSLADLARQAAMRCQQHKQAIAYMCHKCCHPLCLDCTFAAEHADHSDQIGDFSNGIKVLRKYMSDVKTNLESSKKRLEVCIRDTHEDFKITNEVKAQINNLKKTLTEKLHESNTLLDGVDQFRSEVGAAYKSLCETRTNLETSLEQITELDNTGDFEFAMDINRKRQAAAAALKTAEVAFSLTYQMPVFLQTSYIPEGTLGTIEVTEQLCDRSNLTGGSKGQKKNKKK